MNLLKRIFGGGEQPNWEEILEKKPKIIDVRTPGEFKRGHVKGSVNIPLSDLGAHIGKLRKTDKPVITCCASGNRSGAAARKLEALGVEAYNGGPWQRVAQMVKK